VSVPKEWKQKRLHFISVKEIENVRDVEGENRRKSRT
jgi:hypothetical protein